MHYSLANSYFERKLEDKAVTEYKKSIECDPGFIPGYKALAGIYLKKQRFEDASKFPEQAKTVSHEIQGLFDDVAFEYAAYCLDKGTDAFLANNKALAYELIDKALKVKPDLVFTYYTVSYFYFDERKYEEAQSMLGEVIQLEPRFWQAYNLLGDIYFEKGMFEKAVDSYKAGLKINTTGAILQNSLGLALMNLELYDEAIEHLREALRLDCDNANIRYSLASVYKRGS